MKAKRHTEALRNSVTMLDGSGGHVKGMSLWEQCRIVLTGSRTLRKEACLSELLEGSCRTSEKRSLESGQVDLGA